MRRDLFDHYQKLSFRFYDAENTGRLMSRIPNDLFSLAAHRLPTIRKAKRILVLTENGIEEEGTREQPVVAGGAHAGLYNLQLET